jgi:hypothetical protein
VRNPDDPGDKQTYGPGVYLAYVWLPTADLCPMWLTDGGYSGTVRTVLTAVDEGPAGLLKARLQRAFPSPSPQASKDEYVKDIMKRVGYSTRNLQNLIDDPFQLRRPRSLRILSAYTDDHPFSLDLVGAVVRQGLFIDKMHDFGWTEPFAFDREEDEVVLVHCIARYHAYVPTH